jgi:hypothetical protein
MRLPDRIHVDALGPGSQIAGRGAAQGEVLVVLEPEISRRRDEAEVIGGAGGRTHHGGTLQHFLILEIGEALQRRIQRNRRRMGDARRMHGERPRRHLVAEKCQHAERAGAGELDASRNECFVRKTGRDEALPFDVDATLFQQLLLLQDVIDHLLARPDDDPPGIDRPPAFALQPLLRLGRDLVVRLRPPPVGKLLAALCARAVGAGEIAQEQATRRGRHRSEKLAPIQAGG